MATAAKTTTDVEDIAALAAEIVRLCYDSRFNDMTWREIESACEFAMTEVRKVSSQYGSFDKAPAPPA